MFRRFNTRIFVILICFMAVLFFSSVTSRAISNPSKIVNQVKKTLNGVKTLSCSFEYKSVSISADITQNISGTITMKKPYLLRVEYTGQTIVIDGEKIWTYLPKHKQVQISDFEREDEQIVSPHSIFDRYSDKRKAVLSGEEKLNGYDTIIIKLISSDPEENTVTVWIDQALHFPVKAVEETQSGDVTTHILSNVRINEKIDNDIFIFVPPDGISVIDMRE